MVLFLRLFGLLLPNEGRVNVVLVIKRPGLVSHQDLFLPSAGFPVRSAAQNGIAPVKSAALLPNILVLHSNMVFFRRQAQSPQLAAKIRASTQVDS